MFPFKKNNDFSIPSTGISEVRKIQIGDIEQSILIQGENKEKPILFFIHGGPSMPVPGVSCRNADYVIATTTKELVKHFVLVFWDQRGTGKSYYDDIPVESFRVERFISDAIEVVDCVRESFQREKVYIAAHSWGTIIGLSLAKRIPEKLESYIGISQVINWQENDKISYQWLLNIAKEEKNKKMEQELLRLGEPPYTDNLEQWGLLRKWMMKYNSMIHNHENTKEMSLMAGMKPMLKSIDYSYKDLFNAIIKGFKLSYQDQMIKDFAEVDFKKTSLQIDIPIYFFHGRQEKHVYGSLLEEYFELLEAPKGKEIKWFEKSSHMFHPEDAREIEKSLINISKKDDRIEKKPN